MSELEQAVGPLLAKAMADRGFTQLTAVQQAVLDPSLEGRDLRISSQTGSGKTVAIGLAIRELIGEGSTPRPRALVVEPTRELAIVRHLQRYQSRGAEQFIGLLREEAAGMGRPKPR